MEGGQLTLTRPRGPIAAQYKSPGPCYALPGLIGKHEHDPRSIHLIYPAYIFGKRHGKFRDDCSPGPCYYPDSKYSRTGKDGTPHYSLYSRNPDLKGFRTPGPGAYCPEASGPNSKYSPPSYSFGSRYQSRRTDNTPAPNSYSLENTLGKVNVSHMPSAPCHSLRGRSKTGSFHEDLQKTPGPGAYNTTDPSTTKEKRPQFSMTSRNIMPGDGTKKPGPGAHSPERVYINKPQRPKFSFGIRHSQYICPLIVEPCD